VLKFSVLSSVFPLLALGAYAQERWELRKEEDSIRVYTSFTEGSKVKAIRAEFTLRASRQDLFRELLQAERYTEWQYNAEVCTVLDKPSPMEVTYHALVSTPWPVATRDLVVHLKINDRPDQDEFTIETSGRPNLLPVKPGIVRVPLSNGFWKVKQVGPKMLRIIFTMHIDPGGLVPAWLVNFTVAQAPLFTFKNLKDRLER